MKKIIRLNILLTIVIVSFLAITASSPGTERSIPALLPHPTNCAYYFEGNGTVSQVPCNSSCPSNCPGGHFVWDEHSMTLLQCPPPLLFNREALYCDWPNNVRCPHGGCVNN